MRHRWLGPCAAAMLVVLPVLPVAAQEAEGRSQAAQEPPSRAVEEAQQRFHLAEGHYADGDYALALTEFERVFELMSSAGHPNAIYVLYNVALTNQLLNRSCAALEAYERFLAESGPDAPNREDAQHRVQELRSRLALDDVDCSAGSSGQPSASGGSSVSPVGIVVAAVGGAAAIAGGVFGGVALANSESARAECSGSVCPESARAGIADAQTLANVADGLLWGGLAVAATGVVLMFVLADGGETQASAACSPDGCGAVVRGSF